MLAMLGASGPTQATNGTAGSTAPLSQTGTVTSAPANITITGEPSPTPPGGEAIVLDGDYVIAAGGTRSTAVLGAITFDPSGTVVGGTLSFIGVSGVAPAPTPAAGTTGTAATALASAATPITSTTTMTNGGDTIGGDAVDGGDDLGPADPLDPPAAGGATVTDCTVSGGTYTLASGGGGEAQLELDCAGSSLAATWRLFVTGTQGMAVAQQFRAVQLETLPGAADAEIVDLTLTLR